MEAVKPRLGRGLDALLGAANTTTTSAANRLAVNQIQHNPYQPRKRFDDSELKQLTDSIRVHGVLQPLVVRPTGDNFQLIAGERRLRAAQAAGLNEVPVHVVQFNDQQTYEAALVENIQRADLNAIEKAQGFKDYLDRFQITHEILGQKLGIERSTISNLVGLLNLPAEVQDAVRLGQITLGHAKVIKGVQGAEKQAALCKEVILKGLTVAALEQSAKVAKAETPEAAEKIAKPAAEKTAHVQSLENELRQKFASRVEIKVKAKEKGQIVIGFESNDEFERILETLRR